MIRLPILFAALLFAALLFGAPVLSQEEDGGCVLDRRIYPEGYEMCRSGTLKRCESGAWADVGMCEGDTEPPPAPVGGDVVVEPEVDRRPR